MNFTFEEEARQGIRRTLASINKSWVKGNPGELVNYFHADMVIVSPDFQVLGSGREACVKSYIDFCNQAKINDLTESDPEIFVFGNTAVAGYSFELEYEMGGKTHNDTGRDLFVFKREGERWLAVWRMLIQ